MAGASFDGGLSWQSVAIPGITKCSGGDYQRATDPWVSFAPDGDVYQLALSFNDVAPPFTEFDFDHALLVVDGKIAGVERVTARGREIPVRNAN